MIPSETLKKKKNKWGYYYTKFVFHLSMIAEDGPDDLVFDLLLLDPDDDLDDVSPSPDGRVPVLLTESSQSSFGRNEEHVSVLFQIGSAE